MKKLCLLLIVLLMAVAVFAACDVDDSAIDSDLPDSGTPDPDSHVHAGVEWVTVIEPTCTEMGTQNFLCSCGRIMESGRIPAMGHTEKTIPAVAATCDSDGKTEGKECGICGVKIVEQELISATGHKESHWITDSPAKIGMEGSKHTECTVCGVTVQTGTISALIPSVGLEFTSNGNGTCYVSGIGVCVNSEIVIPSVSPAGDCVTGIGKRAFNRCSSIVSIAIPDSVTGIEMGAFSHCSCLADITIPDGVISIGSSAFFNCTSLTSVFIPDSVTSIGDGAFYGCNGLSSIVVGINNPVYHSTDNCLIETQTKSLMIGCKSSVIPMDGSVTSIGNDAFGECIGLTSIRIPNSVTSIGVASFYNCSSLTSIRIPSGVMSIGDWAFRDCSSLTSIVVDEGNTVYHSAGNCLIETASKTLIVGCMNSVIPSDGSVTSIGEYAFCSCSGLTSIEIPDSVISVGDYAFSGSGLRSILIPASVRSIGDNAFLVCFDMRDVYYTGAKAEWSAITIGEYNSYLTSATIHYNYVPEE